MTVTTESPALTNAEYHRHPAISKSHLDLVARSPLHYWAKYMDPNRRPEPYNPAFAIGSAVHAAILEPHVFESDFVVAPDINRRTNAGKEEWAAFEQANAGKTIITAEDAAMVEAMKLSVFRHPGAPKLLDDGEAERTVITRDPETGADVKCRPDWLHPDGVVVDLKTTDDASPEHFARSLHNFRYHVQAAWYTDCLQWTYGEAPAAFVFIVIEKKPPHAVALYRIGAPSMQLGRQLYRRDLQQLLECREADYWPSYGANALQHIDVPAWALK